MGLRPWEFEEYTWYQFTLALSGYREKEKVSWYQTREIIYSVISSGMNRPKKMPSKNEILPLDEQAGYITAEEKEAALEAIRLARSK